METSGRNYRNEFVAVVIIAIIALAAVAYLFESYQSQSSDLDQQRQEINQLQAQVDELNATASSGELAQMKSIYSEMIAIQAQLPQNNSSEIQQELSFVESEVSDLQAALMACSGTQPAPQRTTGPNDTIFVPILLMNPGETATACVTYKTTWAQNSTSYQEIAPAYQGATWNLSLSVYSNTCTKGPGCVQSEISHSFQLSANPSSVELSQYLGYVTVVYHITALSNATGFYLYSVPNGGCSSLSLAVGYTPSEVNASDFNYNNGLHSCFNSPVGVYTAAISGFNSTTVCFPLAAISPLMQNCDTADDSQPKA